MRAIMNKGTTLPFAAALSAADAVLGDLAQLGECLLCKQEVSGSNPLVSIVLSRHLRTDGYQIMKKVFPNEFSDGIEGAVFHPVRVNIV